MKNVKKLLAVALAVTTMAATTLTAFAADSSTTATTTAEPAKVETPAPVVKVATTTEVKVGGETVKSTVTGAYAATAIPAAVVTTPVAEIATAMNIDTKAGEVPFVSTYDVDVKKSYAAAATMNCAAEALNVTVGPMVNFDLGIKKGGTFTTIKEVDLTKTVTVTLPVPASFQKADAKYAVIGVFYGGKAIMFEDKDADAKTVTVDIPVCMGAYAIVQK